MPNYEPNKIDWQVGNFVIHDADDKTFEWLMLVIGKTDNDNYVTIYPFLLFEPGKLPAWGHDPKPSRWGQKRKIQCYYNPKEYLHHPTKFNITIPSRHTWEESK